jgi:hypothetical protein
VPPAPCPRFASRRARQCRSEHSAGRQRASFGERPSILTGTGTLTSQFGLVSHLAEVAAAARSSPNLWGRRAEPLAVLRDDGGIADHHRSVDAARCV